MFQPSCRTTRSTRSVGPRGVDGAAVGLSEQERRWLAALPEDGLRMSGLIVRKLRFERLTGGDHDLRDLFDRDPQAFLPLFRQFTSQVPPESYFPDEEVRRFRQWKHRP